MTLATSARLLLLVLCGCGSSQQAAEQKSAAQVTRAVELLREAPNAAKADALSSLEKLPCTGQEVCGTRDSCVGAYRRHIQAVSLTEAAKLQLMEGKPAEAAKLLGSAQAALSEAKDQVEGCTDRDAALRRRYKL